MQTTAVRLALVALGATLLAAVPLTSATAGHRSPSAQRGSDVVSRAVVYEVENANASKVACRSDDESYQLRGRIVGPRREVFSPDVPRINVLVHDLTSASWFWHLRSNPTYDYATKLAEKGETSIVIDRLGYGSSVLPNGNATCLGAQADIVHQVVQHTKAGLYAFTATTRRSTPHAQHIVLHGHSIGAAIAQVEAATFNDVDGLVLMSWTDSGASELAIDEARRNSELCARGDDYAAYGQTKREYRKLLFVTSPRKIQRRAAALHGTNPCGDALSLSQMLAGSGSVAAEIDEPVLLLFGGKDALNRDGAAQDQADSYSASESVTTRTIAGAGSALPLEKSAPKTRRQVVRWLRATFN